MDPRERWQALQTRLSSARSAMEAGDRARAFEHLDAALAIDPDFPAAQSLRERLRAADPPHAPAPVKNEDAVSSPASKRAVVSAEGYARFEQRAKRRRVDRRIEAARLALQRGRLRDAAAALDEVIELDANLPELAELTAEFDRLRRTISAPRRGPWLMAGAAFAATVLAAAWLDDVRPIAARRFLGSVPLVAAPTPPVVVKADPPPIATTGEIEPPLPRPRPERISRQAEPAPTIAADLRPGAAVAPAASRTVALPPANIIQDSRMVAPAEPAWSAEPRGYVEPPSPRAEATAAPSSAAPAAADATAVIAPHNDEEQMVKQALQRYRAAYEGLDAQSAQEVYPSVNETALARAFDGLFSQRLTFEACDVTLRGVTATATCRGSAKYVPKIGSREPRVEARVWNFTLSKAGSDWRIDTARTDR